MRRLLLVAVLVAACGTTASPTPSPSGAMPSASAVAGTPVTSGSAFPTSPVDGVVVGVDRTSLVDVQGFTIRTDDGHRWEFRVGELENVVDFPPSHLNEHMVDGVPVRVTFDVVGSELVARRLDDAP